MRFFYTLLFLMILFRLDAQEKYHLEVHLNDVTMKLQYKKSFADTAARQNEMIAIIQFLHDKAYLEAGFDSILTDSLLIKGYIHRGPRYILQHLALVDDSTGMIERTGIHALSVKKTVFTQARRDEICESQIKWLENNGYPFASARLSQFELDAGNVNAKLSLNPGPYIVIDSLIRKGNVRISRNFIYRYLGIHSGMGYDESVVLRIPKRLKDLPFVTMESPPEVAFYENKAHIYLYINKKKSSSFSGILGVLPNSQVPGKVLINGDVKLKLLNSFGQGELIDLNWRSLEKGTQDLKVTLNYPYLLSTPLGLDYQFYLYKKDTSYLTLQNNIGIRYLLGGNNYLQLFTEIFRSDIINATGLETVTVLPSYADVSRNMFGLEYFSENLDYRLNPRKGLRIKLSGSGGIKTIRKNEKINPIVYDSLDLKTGQFQAVMKMQGFVPLFRKQTLLIDAGAAWIYNDLLFDNELFRLGGMSSLRGFDEESLSANAYATLLLEYRYLFEKNSFLALFWNGAWIERNTHASYLSDLPYGIGAGISFDTKIGIFSLYYALGSQQHNPLSFKQSKIHFGVSTYF